MGNVKVRRFVHRDENGVIREVDLGGGGGKRTCRFTVGSSAAGWTAEDCDYLCDGYIDNEAKDALLSRVTQTGGEILFLDGEYTFQSNIAITNSEVPITLSGCGEGTVLKIPAHSVSIYITNSKNITIQDIKIEETQNSSGQTSAIAAWATSNLTVRNVTIKGFSGYAIEADIWTSEEKLKNIRVEGCKIDTKKTAVEIRCADDCLIRGNMITINQETYGAITYSDWSGSKHKQGHNIVISENVISASIPLADWNSAAICPGGNCVVTNNSMKNFACFLRPGTTFRNLIMCGNLLVNAVAELPPESMGVYIENTVVYQNNLAILRTGDAE